MLSLNFEACKNNYYSLGFKIFANITVKKEDKKTNSGSDGEWMKTSKFETHLCKLFKTIVDQEYK